MPLKPTSYRPLTIFVVGIILAGLGANATSSVRVEVWTGGDDGLTLRLRDTLESAFKSTPDFILSNGKIAGTLLVTIPTNVDWKKIGRRTQVVYAVRFTSVDGQSVGTSSGSCWENALEKCADHIVADARNAVPKLR